MQSEGTPDSGYSWLVAAITLLVASVSFGAVTSIPILLKPMTADLGWSRSAVSFGHTLAMFGAAVGSLFLGRWLDRYGFFRIALVGALATGLGLVAASAATRMWQLYCAYGLLVGGLGQAAFFGPLAAAVSMWFERHRALAISIATSGQSVGGLVVPLVLRSGAEEFGWRQVLQMYGVFAALTLTVCALVFLRDPPLRRASSAAIAANAAVSPEDSLIRKRDFIFLAIGLALSNFANFVVMGHVTAFGEESGLSPTNAAGILSVLLGTTLISRFSWGYFAIHFGEYRMLVTASWLQVLGVAIIAGQSSHVWILIAAAVIGLSFGAYLPGYAVMVRDMFPAEQAGRRITEIYFFGFIAAGLGTWSGGLVHDHFGGYRLAFLCALVGSALAPWVLFLRRSSLRRLGSSESGCSVRS